MTDKTRTHDEAPLQTTAERQPESADHSLPGTGRFMPPDPRAEMLALQDSAGNQAVTQMIQPEAPVSRPGEPMELEADALAARALNVPLPSSSDHVQHDPSPNGAALPTGLRQEMETRFGHPFDQVRLHADAKAAQEARMRNARAFTFGSQIYFDQGRYAPQEPVGQRLLAHELAHVVQQQQGAPSMIRRVPNALSDAVPEAERQRIRVITTVVDPASMAGLFSTETATTTVNPPSAATLTYDAAIPEALQRGLRNVAGTLIPDPLHLNAAIVLDLDLTAHGGGHNAYRFTYVEHQPAERGGTPTQEILIEDLGEVGSQQLDTAQQAAQQQRFQQHNFHRGSGWSDDQYNMLLLAIAMIPDSMLTPVDGLTFNRDTAHPNDADTGGDYDPDTHTITMYDLIFGTYLTRFGMGQAAPAGGGEGAQGEGQPSAAEAAPAEGSSGSQPPAAMPTLSNDTVRSIVHEIGHAIDLLPLRQAWTNYEQAAELLETAFAQYQEEDGSYRFPNSEQANWNRLSAALAAAEASLTAARSESGHRYEENAEGGYDPVEGPAGADDIAFRDAALQDGQTRLTAYADEEWQEYYAESFSMYITDPDTLLRLRPNVSAYFTREHPR